MSPLPETFDALSEAARNAQSPIRNAPDRPEVAVSGTSGDSAATVHLHAGRVTRIDLRDSVLERDTHEVGEVVAEAMNAALEAHDRAVVQNLQGQTNTDLMALTRQLDEIGRDAQRTLDSYVTSMDDMLRRASKEATS